VAINNQSNKQILCLSQKVTEWVGPLVKTAKSDAAIVLQTSISGQRPEAIRSLNFAALYR
jgi:hypothetical protein